MGNVSPNSVPGSAVADRLSKSGLRPTAQRRQVYSVISAELDHPTAEQIFMQAKRNMPDISIATVYNCLDTLVKCDLIREVRLDRAATRYCPNMQDHSHFYCEKCGEVYDVYYTPTSLKRALKLPDGFALRHLDLAMQGLCNSCKQAG